MVVLEQFVQERAQGRGLLALSHLVGQCVEPVAFQFSLESDDGFHGSSLETRRESVGPHSVSLIMDICPCHCLRHNDTLALLLLVKTTLLKNRHLSTQDDVQIPLCA